jgi:predicted small lipoprotein YifL
VRLSLVLLVMLAAAACGKKGPPLPPLVLVPEPPPELAAVRRGPRVDLSFTIPKANTDRSTPADLERVDIYALTTSEAVSVEDVVRRGVRVGSLAVNKPKDPDEPEPTTPPVEPRGLSQGDRAAFSETVGPPDEEVARRNYVAAGYNQRGRRGPLSARVAVPLGPVAPTPSQPTVAYDEKAITVSWPAAADSPDGPYSYSVYRPGRPAAMTTAPLSEPTFTDPALVWEEERCYEVRAGQTIDDVRVEGAASPVRCVTPHDTFAPARPDGLVSVASEGAISLIWSANHEADLAGYVVMRAIAPATALTPVSETPITDTNFKDAVPSGANVTYAILAVDKAGNRSEPSESTTETAR